LPPHDLLQRFDGEGVHMASIGAGTAATGDAQGRGGGDQGLAREGGAQPSRSRALIPERVMCDRATSSRENSWRMCWA
jgi:hypothetical protein